MDAFLTCCGCRRKREQDVEQGLLAEYGEDTALQHRVHAKMHTYQMLHALADGYLPSNEQLVANLRTLLAADLLSPDEQDLSDDGRKLAGACKQGLRDFMRLLQSKNGEDQLQDFVWCLSHADISVNTKDVSRRASNMRAKADATAAYESVRTIGSLLLANSEFRIFLDDLHTITRQVFADTASSVSNVADQTAKKLEPSDVDKNALKHPDEKDGKAPRAEDLAAEVDDINQAVGDGALQIGKEGLGSARDNLDDETRHTLLQRLKATVMSLRKRTDYSQSASTIALLIRRYAEAYSRVADQTITAVQEDVHTNDELDRASRNLWSLLRSFGESKEWESLEDKMSKAAEHANTDPDFESLAAELGDSIQKLLLDPDFFDTAEDKLQKLQEKAEKSGSQSSLREDIDAALIQSRRTLHSVLQDADVAALRTDFTKTLNILSPPSGSAYNPDLLNDALNAFIPALISAIQHIPIPRVEVSTPDIDLLLESLIIEPGRTVNHTSFLPHRLHLTTRTELDVRAARTRTVSATSTLITLTVSGLTMRAEDIGFWMHLHAGLLLNFTASGLASARLDGTGLELEIDVEVQRASLENILTLRGARVRAPTFDYSLRNASGSAAPALPWLATLTKPLVRPILRRTLEKAAADAVAEACHFANRELVFARERLRATRVADPKDLMTFVRAVAARWVPEEDPDVFTRVEDEAGRGWRNAVFDVGGASTGPL